ncbi:hypothetical protein GVY41_05365 [Frigidibacter albus]|uniref:Uncharacterized protein n=1 Tax=Frigidibacter albus TaxID=1465486 RepID=A0A6L8VEJ0_9RHOB|nr:hypothetical protein [Frigidibacter albus]MZQ88758.1 hypothetical protein [Frigidibacter albus]NBE30433.1 hypothetical protein [Frigidibacter albus]GGH50311.1 hypothetical protein GCM10011341_13200 [Frigidibacter albus]
MAMQDNLGNGTVQAAAGDWMRRFAAGFRAAPRRTNLADAQARLFPVGTTNPQPTPRDQAMPAPLTRQAAPFDPSGARASEFDLIETELLAHRHVVMVGGSADQGLLDHTLWLQDHVADLQTAADLGAAAAMVAPLAADTGLMLVDMDALRADAVTLLQGFRDRYPDVAVVIGSRRFARNDFSCERALIADASLRLPARRIAFALAMSSAIHNNRVIRSR